MAYSSAVEQGLVAHSKSWVQAPARKGKRNKRRRRKGKRKYERKQKGKEEAEKSEE